MSRLSLIQGTNVESIVGVHNYVVGTRVSRGRDWIFGEQDHYNGIPGEGTIIGWRDDLWAKVTWDNGLTSFYGIGIFDRYDLYLSPEQHHSCQLVGSEVSMTKNHPITDPSFFVDEHRDYTRTFNKN